MGVTEREQLANAGQRPAPPSSAASTQTSTPTSTPVTPPTPTATPTPTAAELLGRTRALLPMIRAMAPLTHERGQVPDEIIAAFKEAGLFRIVQPRRYGGYEMHPNVLFDAQMLVGTACVSTAWVYGLLAVHNFQLALFDDRAQAEVWSRDPDTLVSSTYQPVGKVVRTEGGFRLSGRWRFSSGARHGDWIFLGGFMPPATPDGERVIASFLLPRADYRIIDGTWDVVGMRGTGSLDIEVDDAFVPEYRTHSLVEGFEIVNQRGLAVNTSPLYRLPWGQLFARIVATAQVGGLQGALDAYLDLARTRISTANFQAMTADPHAAAAAAHVKSEIAEIRSTLHRTFDDALASVEATGEIPMEDRLRYRYEAARIARRCAAAVDELMAVMGSAAIYATSPVYPYWRDIMASRAHFANNPDNLAVSVGGSYLGVPSNELFC